MTCRMRWTRGPLAAALPGFAVTPFDQVVAAMIAPLRAA
jgi:hypothetical protein